MINIVHIKFKSFLPGNRISSIHLRPPGNARLHRMAAALEISVEGKVLGEPWPGADQRHVAPEDVEELGKLVEGSVADDLSKGGEPQFVGQEGALRVPAVVHGPELDETEDLFALARPFLYKKDLAAIEDYLQKNNQHDQRRQGQDQEERCQEIEDRLD